MKIGSILPLTGALASSGTDAQHGEELAVDIINGEYPNIKTPLAGESGLPGLASAKVQLITKDTTGDPQTAASALADLATTEKVAAVVGGYSSGVTATAAQNAERLGVPFVTGISSADSLTASNPKWFFRVGPSDTAFADTVFKFLNAQKAAGKDVSKIAVIYRNDTYGNGILDAVKKQVASNGWSLVKAVPYDPASKDLTPMILSVKSAGPDVVIHASLAADAVLFTRNMNTIGWNPNALIGFGGYDDPGYLPALGSGAEGIIQRSAWSPDVSNPVSSAVADLFKQKYGRDMTENSARAYSSVMAVAMAINNAKSVDRGAIRTALETLDVPGSQLIEPWSAIKFNANHENTGASAVLEQAQDGKWTTIFAAGEPAAATVWPMR